MNITKLFEMQKGLEARIEEKHPRGNENRLRLKCVALGVEISEAANEYRGFKFWSNDREPRTRVMDEEKLLKGDNLPYSEIPYKNPLLEETVDVLHFILSIGLEIDFNPERLINQQPFQYEDTLRQFADLSVMAWSFPGQRYKMGTYLDMWRVYLGLVEHLGFTWDEIEAAYCSKNSTNHARQESGY